MKTLLKSILPVVGLFAVTINGQAVEYVTLLSGEELTVVPSSVAECVGKIGSGPTEVTVKYSFNRQMAWGGDYLSFAAGNGPGPVVGLVRIANASGPNNPCSVTFKITKADEINVVSPTSLLVLPENSTGDYDVLLETSSDAGTWSPFLSQTVAAADAKRFFRARIVKKN